MRPAHLVSLLIVVGSLPLSAQDNQNNPFLNKGKLTTPSQMLRERHVDTSPQGLVEALSHPDAIVRSLAAQELALEHAHDAVASLEKALSQEKSADVRLNLGVALTQLGDSKGYDGLTAVCSDPNAPTLPRVMAVRFLAASPKTAVGCLDSILKLTTSGSAESRAAATLTLPSFKDLGPEISNRALQTAVGLLSDKDAGVRHAASHALAEIGDPSVIESLQTVMARERDQQVLQQMKSDLQTLQEKVKR